MHIRPHTTGLLVAILLGGFHFLWSVLVFLGVAQMMYDFILWAHMIHLPLVIGSFALNAAVTLVLMTTVVGYVVGYMGALVWNWLHR